MQLEEKRQASEPAANESVSLSTATVVAAAASTVSTVHNHNHFHLQPESSMTQFLQKAMHFKMYFL